MCFRYDNSIANGGPIIGAPRECSPAVALGRDNYRSDGGSSTDYPAGVAMPRQYTAVSQGRSGFFSQYGDVPSAALMSASWTAVSPGDATPCERRPEIGCEVHDRLAPGARACLRSVRCGRASRPPPVNPRSSCFQAGRREPRARCFRERSRFGSVWARGCLGRTWTWLVALVPLRRGLPSCAADGKNSCHALL
jgi:hypothetical protein